MATAQIQLHEMQVAMARTNALFNDEVFGKRNFAALDKIYTADARILPPGGPMILGRDAIKTFWSGLIQSTNATSAALTSVDIMLTGDGAIEIGSATIALPDAKLEVKYVVYWLPENGLMKWHVDVWNPNA
jgi:ketosteroid isomerase-like protein